MEQGYKMLDNTYLKLDANGKINQQDRAFIWGYRRIEWGSKKIIGETREDCNVKVIVVV
jgi:hypothetical protein